MTADNSSATSKMPSVLDEMMRGLFKEPATPTLHRADVVQMILEKMRQRDIIAEFILLSDGPASPQSLYDASGTRVQFPPDEGYRRCFVALIDPHPLTKWAHEAFWAFIPAGGGEVVLQPTSWPYADGPVRFTRESLPR